MAINGRRNKPFGPGGSTRRLHHQDQRSSGSAVSNQSEAHQGEAHQGEAHQGEAHQSKAQEFLIADELLMTRGRNRIDEGVKGGLLLGMVPPISGHAIVANDNYAPVAQAA
jgi:hypothetical protein